MPPPPLRPKRIKRDKMQHHVSCGNGGDAMKTGAIKASTTPIWQHSLVLFMTVSLIMFSLGLIISGQAKVFATADDSPIEQFWITNGIVNKVLPAGDVTYIAGDFSMVGPANGLGVPVDATTGSPVATCPEVNNLIRDAIADGSGGWFIGGYFTAVGGQTRNYIAHILADGSVDPARNPGAPPKLEVLAPSGN